MKTNTLPKCACLACNKVLDRATSVDQDIVPNTGDITICLSCGHLMAFADDLSFRALTCEEMIVTAGDRRILDIQHARGLIPKGRM